MKITTAYKILEKSARDYIKLKGLQFSANLWEEGHDLPGGESAYNERRDIETALAVIKQAIDELKK